MWYPKSEEGDHTSLLAELTRLDASEYNELVYNWPMQRLILYIERSRVRKVFDEIS